MEAWGSMGPYKCSGCNDCGTTLDTHPTFHKIPEPHKFEPTDVETDEGTKKLSRCVYCGRTRKELDEL